MNVMCIETHFIILLEHVSGAGAERERNLKKYGGAGAERSGSGRSRERSGERAELAAHNPLKPNN